MSHLFVHSMLVVSTLISTLLVAKALFGIMSDQPDWKTITTDLSFSAAIILMVTICLIYPHM